MNQVLTIVFSIISFLVQNRDSIKKLILDIETLIPDSPGSQKAAAVKGMIAASLGVESQIETVWPFVAPVFNALVANVKTKPAEPAPAQ